MDYKKFFSRGIRYINAAGKNWTVRRANLIAAWTTPGRSVAQCTIIERLVKELDLRISTLGYLVWQHRQKQVKQQYLDDQARFPLFCSNYNCCNSYHLMKLTPSVASVVVGFKYYEPGKHKCGVCGSDMWTEAEKSADRLFDELGFITQ